MSIKKNVASQKVGFIMCDKTDFATPETGITVSGVIRKDGGASAAVTNTVSELTNGYYVLTLTNSETNADLIQLRFHDSGASCCTQFLTFYTEDVSISDVLSTLDGPITNYLTSILTDTSSTLLNNITSILADTTSILIDTTSILIDTTSILIDTSSGLSDKIDSILADTGTTLDNKIDSILEDTGTTLENRTTSIVDIASDILSTLDGPITSSINVIENIVTSVLNDTTSILIDTTSILIDTTSILIDTTSILVDTSSGLSDKIDSILEDTGTTLDNKLDSLLAESPAGIKKNTALDDFEFLMFDAADHVTPITSLTSNISGYVSKDGGAFAAMANTPAEVSNGVYKVDITNSELNADIVTLIFQATGADQRTITLKTV